MIKFIAADLDNTLVFPRGGVSSLLRLFAKYKIAPKHVLDIYAKAKQSGLSSESLIRAAQEYVDAPLDRGTIEHDIERWLKKSIRCYPDALASVTKWREANIPVIIVTVGAPEFQKKKIELSGLSYDDVCIVDSVNNKSDTLRTLLARFGAPCIFIDDKASELDAVVESGITSNEVLTYRIRRTNGPYYGQKPVHAHTDIKHLDDPRLMEQIYTP